MTQIPFVQALGDAIEAAAAQRIAASPPSRLRRHGWRARVHPHRRLAAVLAVVALGGAAAGAATLGNDSASLVASGIACYEGTDTGASAYFDVTADGRSPQAACAQTFKVSGPAALAAPAALVACTDPHGYVAVFRSDGSGTQCADLGMKRLAAQRYAAGARRVDALVADLARLVAARTCVPTRLLLAKVQRVLASDGWLGWRAGLDTTGRHGPCGRFEPTGSSVSPADGSLDGQHHVVWVTGGPRAPRGRP